MTGKLMVLTGEKFTSKLSALKGINLIGTLKVWRVKG